MPVVWQVVTVEGAGSEARLHLIGKVIRALVRDDVNETITASIPAGKVRGGVYFVQPGAILVSVPYNSDWLSGERDPRLDVIAPFGFGDTGAGIPVDSPMDGGYFSASYVLNMENHAAFFLLATDSHAAGVQAEIIMGFSKQTGKLQIVLGRPASNEDRRRLLAKGFIPSKQIGRRYHPYIDEFESSVMSEWVEQIPPIMAIPEMMEDESYTLIGYVSLRVPPHSIEIRREHEVETQPVLRSSTLHKAPRANLTHEWTINFVVVGEDINTRLVPLLRAIDRCPFLPVTNLVFNQAGIFEIVVDQVEVTTMQDHPNALQVTLAGRRFDTGGLGFVEHFGANFNWPLFKLYADYLPRFLPITLPMDGKVRILSPSDRYISDVINRLFDDTRIAERLGFASSGGNVGGGDGVRVPPDVLFEPGSGQFALLPLPDDPTRVGRYEVVIANSPSAFRQLAQAVMDRSVPGLEARSVNVYNGDVYISQYTLSSNELERFIVNVDSGKQGIIKSTLESVAFCWRLDSIGQVRASELDSSLSRMLSATFMSAGARRRSSGPASSGVSRSGFVTADMVPFLPEGVNVVWQSISAGFGNMVAALRRDVGDPIMQYLGKTDITIVLQGVVDSAGLAVLRSLFDRYIAITYLLRGLSFLHPVRLNFQIDNEIARLMGVEEVIPISLDVRTMEGTPDAYEVTLTFVSMDPGGVQRRALRRLSENVTRQERMFNMTYSGVDASRELDRLYAALRRSELYPDLRLPTYGLLIDWCKTLAYQNGMMWDYARNSLKELSPGLTEESFRIYLEVISHHMQAFLNRISRSGLLRRMASIPYVFADPDFFFHNGDSVSSQIRGAIMREIGAGAQFNAVYVDDNGVASSVQHEDGKFSVRVMRSTGDLAQIVEKHINKTVQRHPELNQLPDLTKATYGKSTGAIKEAISQVSGVRGEDVIAASSKDQIEAYSDLDKRFREAFAIPESPLTLEYEHDVRDDSVSQQISATEQQHIDRLRGVASVNATRPVANQLFGAVRSAVASNAVVDGVKQNVSAAVDALIKQAANPPADHAFRLNNVATDQTNPATWTVIWKPKQFALAVRLIRMLGNRLKPFIMGMYEQESSFNPHAQSGSANGIAQFTPETWRGLLRSGRYSVNLATRSGNIPSMSEFRWDLASLMGMYYFMEMIIDAVVSVSGKDQKLRYDFANYLCAESRTFFHTVLKDPLSALSGDQRMGDRLMVLGACLYNTGPHALRSVIAQLSENVAKGRKGPAAFDIGRTNRGHGKLVYEKYRRWAMSNEFTDQPIMVARSGGDGGNVSTSKEVYGPPSPFIADTNIPNRMIKDFENRYVNTRPGNGKASITSFPVLSGDSGKATGSSVKSKDSGISDLATPMPSERINLTGDPFNDVHNLKNFPLLPLTGWSDMCRHQPHGRLIQCFPTYCMLLVQGGRWVRWHRFWDHFYGLFSVMSIDVHKSRESPQHTAEIILSNSYRQLSNLPVTQAYAQAVIAGMRPFQQVQGEELFRGGGPESAFIFQLVKSIQNHLFPILGDYERHVWNQELKSLFLHPGERIHLRIGYGADAATLPVVFNGTIASVDIQGSVIRLLALGDGRELMKDIATEGQPYKNSNLFGQTVEIRNIVIDLLVSRRAESVPVVGPMIYTFSAGGFMNDSRFGIESFGRIETLAGSAAMADAAAGNWSIRTFKILGALSFQAAEGEVGVNIYNSQRDSGNFSIGMLPLLDTLTLGLSQLARNGDFIAIELKQGTIWDVLRNCQLAMLDALMSVEPFGLRSTLFLGRGHQALHYDYYNAGQLEALGIKDIATRISLGGFWRIMRFRQYRQYHIAISDWNLISNELVATTEKMWNEVQSFDAEGVPGNKFTFDPAIVPEDRKPFYFHSALSTTLMSQLSLGAENNWVSVLGRIGFIRNIIGERLGIAMPIRAVNNVSANLVREGVSYMYDGSLVLVGAAEIKPYDMIFIDDPLRAMHGPVLVREVEHHFSTQHGYSSLIVPDACVLGNGDIENSTIYHASRMSAQLVAFYKMRKDLMLFYRSYLLMLLTSVGFALNRVRYLLRKVPLANTALDRVAEILGIISKGVSPKRNEIIDLIKRAVLASYGLGKDFAVGIGQGAWNWPGFKSMLREVFDGLKLLYSAAAARDGAAVASAIGLMFNSLTSLGTVRPLLQVNRLLSTSLKVLLGRTTLLLMVAGSVLEMVNRKLNSYYPCRLYPVSVNDLPLTAGIRGHFGTVQGDDPSPLQTILDTVTLNLPFFRDSSVRLPFVFDMYRQVWGFVLRLIWPLQRNAPARVEMDEELIAAGKLYDLRSRYQMIGMFGTVREIYDGVSPTLSEGSNDRLDRQPFRRTVVGYAKNDDPSKGDYLLAFMDQRAATILGDLINTLRSRGVQLAIHQGRRSLDEQHRLYQQLLQGGRSKAVAKPTPTAPHVAGRAIDVQYRYPDGTYRSTPPASQESIILQVVQEMNRKYAPAKVRWLGDKSKYSGSLFEPWHFDVSFGGG